MKRLIFLLLVVVLSCNQADDKTPHVLIETRLGDIELELYPEKAPVTVAAFLSYVDSGYYSNSSFYRVLKADELPNPNNTGIIQGGIWQTKPEIKVRLSGIKHESTAQSGLTHQSGTVSLARTTPGSASSEFFICIGDQSPLDAGRRGTEDGQGFAAFGKVIKGMPIVRKIQEQKSHGDAFDKKIEIYKIKRL
ncbi:MAG TPA: peptidylprolyl isomerase [Ferruginibacter sp.]|nr:peptidylprolyl isomerase [Ferruginibacter sp.]